MGNINLRTSKVSEVFIDSEIKYLKSIGYKISKVDFVNIILEEVNDNVEYTDKFRDKVIEILENQKKEIQKRYKDIRGEMK